MGNPNTAVFPAAVATDTDLLVAQNNADSTLTASMTNVATTFTVANGSVFNTPCLVSIGSEIILVGSFAGNVGTATSRHFGGTAAAAHSNGDDVLTFIDQYYFNQLAAEVKAIETGLGANFVNVKGMNTGAVFSHATLATANVTVTGTLAIPFDTNIVNTGAAHSTSVNPTRFTVPSNMGGLYMVSTAVRWAAGIASSSNFVAVAINKNGTQWAVTAEPQSPATTVQNLSVSLLLAAGDFIEVAVTQVGSTTLDVVASGPQTFCQLAKLA